MRGITTLLAIACFALQAVVYGKSSGGGGQTVHCVVWPFGDCAPTMAAGYRALIGGPVAGYQIGAALGLLVPALMVWAFVFSSHGPKLVLERAGRRVASRAALVYLLTLVAIVGLCALRLERAAAAPVPAPGPGSSARLSPRAVAPAVSRSP